MPVWKSSGTPFEGHITDKKLTRLKKELEGRIETDEDSVQIYKISSEVMVQKEKLGTVTEFDSIIG